MILECKWWAVDLELSMDDDLDKLVTWISVNSIYKL